LGLTNFGIFTNCLTLGDGFSNTRSDYLRRAFRWRRWVHSPMGNRALQGLVDPAGEGGFEPKRIVTSMKW
jgi:hypothetical protein